MAMNEEQSKLVEPVDHIVTYEDIQGLVKSTRPNVNQECLANLEKWRREFGDGV